MPNLSEKWPTGPRQPINNVPEGKPVTPHTAVLFHLAAKSPGASDQVVHFTSSMAALHLLLITQATLLCSLCILVAFIVTVCAKHVLCRWRTIHVCITTLESEDRIHLNLSHPVLALSELAVMVFAVLDHSL